MKTGPTAFDGGGTFFGYQQSLFNDVTSHAFCHLVEVDSRDPRSVNDGPWYFVSTWVSESSFQMGHCATQGAAVADMVVHRYGRH